MKIFTILEAVQLVWGRFPIAKPAVAKNRVRNATGRNLLVITFIISNF